MPDYHRTRLQQLNNPKISTSKCIQSLQLLFCTYKFSIGMLEFQHKCNRLENTLIAKKYISFLQIFYIPGYFVLKQTLQASGGKQVRKHQIFYVLSFTLTAEHICQLQNLKKELKSQVLLSVKLRLNGTLHPNEQCGASCSTPKLSHGLLTATDVSWSCLALLVF